MEKDKRKLKIAGIAGIIIAIILLVFIGTQVNKYRFGYFVKGPQMKYEHDGDILKLEDGNILILGSNSHKSPYQNRWSINDLKILETPSEIYNVSENKFEEFHLKSPIAQKLGDTFTEAEEVTVPRDPLLIDLDGDGIETTTVENGVYFDHESDGFAEMSAWVGKTQKAA